MGVSLGEPFSDNALLVCKIVLSLSIMEIFWPALHATETNLLRPLHGFI